MRPLEPDDPRSAGSGDRSYRVLARLGSGGMGVVYFGRSLGGRAVAIKLVHPDLAEDPQFRERFRREAAAAGAVGGAFTAAVLDADPDAAVPWLVSEFLAGVSLEEAVQEAGALPAATVRPLAAGIVEALRAIHQAGIVHRDLKPANVLLTGDGPRVIDFGIARALDAATVTRPGEPAGSPGFMSPEQVAGVTAGPAGDVFSLGSTLAFACTGTEPFGEGPWHAKMFRIESETPRLDGIEDQDLRALIVSCMERDPQRRPSTGELTERLAAPPHDDASWLPAPVVDEITRRASEADDPPPPLPAGGAGGLRRVRRRGALTVGAVAVVPALVAGGVIATWPPPGGAAEPAEPTGSAGPTTPPAPASSVRTSPASTRRLEFYFTGDTELASLTYTVNGRDTTLEDVDLPWSQVVRIPALPRKSRWRLRYEFPPGEIRVRVLVDGFEVATGNDVAAGTTGEGDVDGTV